MLVTLSRLLSPGNQAVPFQQDPHVTEPKGTALKDRAPLVYFPLDMEIKLSNLSRVGLGEGSQVGKRILRSGGWGASNVSVKDLCDTASLVLRDPPASIPWVPIFCRLQSTRMPWDPLLSVVLGHEDMHCLIAALLTPI